MNRVWYILFLGLTVLAAGDALAQDGVVVHGDPRLGLLIKKERTLARASVERERPAAKVRTADKALPAAGKTVVPTAGKTTTAATGPALATTNTAAPVSNEKPAAPMRTFHPKYISPPNGKVIYSGKGFRVQIYYGPDRGKAMDIKMEFSRQHPNLRTYITYASPCFRVKVGNYRNRSDAEGVYREAKSVYTPCMIVPDIITINTY